MLLAFRRQPWRLFYAAFSKNLPEGFLHTSAYSHKNRVGDPIICTHWRTTRGKLSPVKKVVNFGSLSEICGKSGLPVANPAKHDDYHMRPEIENEPETGSNRLQIEHRPHQTEAFSPGNTTTCTRKPTTARKRPEIADFILQQNKIHTHLHRKCSRSPFGGHYSLLATTARKR